MTQRLTKAPVLTPSSGAEPQPASPYVMGKRAARQATERVREGRRRGVTADVQQALLLRDRGLGRREAAQAAARLQTTSTAIGRTRS